MFTPKARRTRPGIASIIFLTSVLMLHVSALSIPAGIQNITDADIREIASLLFELEFPTRAEGEETVVLLDPNFRPLWIPQLKGIRFKQLAYEEVKQVSEYYTLNRSGERNEIKFSLVKGNYCRKAGPVYSFRRVQGKWRAEPAGYSESNSSSGTRCVGCQTGSGAIYTARRMIQSERGEQVNPENELKKRPLTLSGRVLGVRCHRDDRKYIECKADLSLDFSNSGDEPVIILQPYEEYSFWHGATSLALTRADAETYTYVYNSGAWPSVYTTPMYSQLADMLDQPLPPPDVTRVIKPGEGWTWVTTIHILLQEENACDGTVGVEIGWKEIKKLSSPLWLQVSYEMWPFNVENFKENLSETLSERWKTYGALYLEERLGGHASAILTSEPIELDLRGIELE